MKFEYDDGGRALAGFKGTMCDCVARAIDIATQKPYREIYDVLNALAYGMRQTYRTKMFHSRTGVCRLVYERYLKSLGWNFISCISVGSGCKVHLREDELSKGKIIYRLLRHLATVVDGVLHNTHDCSCGGTRCVYGYFVPNKSNDLTKGEICL